MIKLMKQIIITSVLFLVCSPSVYAHSYDQTRDYNSIQSKLIRVSALPRVEQFIPTPSESPYRTTLGHRFKRKIAYRLQYVRVKPQYAADYAASPQELAMVRYNQYVNSTKNYWP